MNIDHSFSENYLPLVMFDKDGDSSTEYILNYVVDFISYNSPATVMIVTPQKPSMKLDKLNSKIRTTIWSVFRNRKCKFDNHKIPDHLIIERDTRNEIATLSRSRILFASESSSIRGRKTDLVILYDVPLNSDIAKTTMCSQTGPIKRITHIFTK
jgi:hypothetical protein